MEFFAGNAACTTFARCKGFRGCKFDIKYFVENTMRTRKSNYMDVNSDSGFMPFGSKPCPRNLTGKNRPVLSSPLFQDAECYHPSIPIVSGITLHDLHTGC